MRISILEAICGAHEAPIKEKCPITAKTEKDTKLHDVPETFIRNVIDLMDRQFKVAGNIIADGKSGDDNLVWFTASQEAHALEELVWDYLRCHRNEDRTFHYTLHKDWKYSVSGPFAQ